MKKKLVKPIMRVTFAMEVHKQMKKNKNVWVLVNDLGYKMWDRVRIDYPDRFINVGAAEQSMIGIATGLALNGKIPIVYSITTFLIYRPFETIRNYLNHEKIAVKLIGSGRDKEYNDLGISHWAEEDKDIMKIFKNIKSHWPNEADEIPRLINNMIKDKNPWYVNLKR